MTQLALDMMEWLQAKPGVARVTDASTDKYGDAIRCSYGGANWIITLNKCGVNCLPSDPREVPECDFTLSEEYSDAY